MQIVALYQRMHGDFMNWEENLISAEKYQDRQRRSMEEMQELIRFIPFGAWPEGSRSSESV